MALQTWTQLEIGLCEFTETLGKDKFTLEELRDVLEMGDVRLPDEFVIDVRQASKLLSIETAGIQVRKIGGYILVTGVDYCLEG